MTTVLTVPNPGDRVCLVAAEHEHGTVKAADYAKASPFASRPGWHDPYRDSGWFVRVQWDNPEWGLDSHPVADVRVLAEAGTR